jgi:hypothetical protein
MKKLLMNFLVLSLGISIALFIIEGLLRIFYHYEILQEPDELSWFAISESSEEVFVVDDALGFRPILNNRIYNQYGTLPNSYDIKDKSGIIRLLFLGDSVTARGEIIRELKKLYGEEQYEYWNAGVEAYNTVQEIKFFQMYNSLIKPDHVILTFHNNDFLVTPVAFYNKGNPVLYAPDKEIHTINPWLFTNSNLYRLYFGFLAGFYNIKKDVIDERIVREIEDSLFDLKNISIKQGINFTVLLLPILRPYEEWSEQEKMSREISIKIFKDLNIRFFDLMETPNLTVRDVMINDRWHPNKIISWSFAKYLYNNGLL